MAKQIDETKLERTREAAISLISQYGLTNASVADIAREAGVSSGYLYRHYAGKEELLDDLLNTLLTRINDRIAFLAESMTCLEDVIEGIVAYIFEIADKKPEHIRFCLNLQNDLSYMISTQVIDRLKSLFANILEKGLKTGIIGQRITAEDLYLAMLCMPLQYIGIRLRGAFKEFNCNTQEIRHVSSICLSAIKNI